MARPEAAQQKLLLDGASSVSISAEQIPERSDRRHRIEIWTPEDVGKIRVLEEKMWAPWLQKPERQIRYIAEHFPRIQFLVRDTLLDDIDATLTTNRIDMSTLPKSWDEAAGGSVEESNYAKTYQEHGNTLILMAANVDPDKKKQASKKARLQMQQDLQRRGIYATDQLEPEEEVHHASQMLRHLQEAVINPPYPELEGIEYIISYFRPSQYGQHKLKQIREGKKPLSFEEYCRKTRDDGELEDRWLRSVTGLGMKLVERDTPDGKKLHIAEQSMRVEVDLDTFRLYQLTYHPDRWEDLGDGQWECGETGSWQVYKDKAVYTEPNVLGMWVVPQRPAA